MKGSMLAAAAAVFLTGCAHVISADVLREINQDITFADLRENPGAFEGQLVLVGGIIVETVNQDDGTLLEIYQTRLNKTGRPVKPDVSGGRFLAFSGDYMDREIFRKGRKVTIAGTVRGERTQKLGEVDYRYPYLLIREIHLWAVESLYTYDRYPYWYSPWYPWYPYPDPYWRYGRYYRY